MILPVEQRQIRPCWNDFDETKICMYLYYFGDYPCSKNEGRYAEYNENSFDVTYNDYKFMKNNIDLNNKTKLVSISLAYIDDIKICDLSTLYLITKLKKDFKIS